MRLKSIKNTKEFKEIILNGKSIVMIHKTGCPYCIKAMPWMKEFAQEYEDKIICEVNKENISEIMAQFQVEMYPTFISFNKGKIENMFFGDTQYDKVKSFIEKNI